MKYKEQQRDLSRLSRRCLVVEAPSDQSYSRRSLVLDENLSLEAGVEVGGEGAGRNDGLDSSAAGLLPFGLESRWAAA